MNESELYIFKFERREKNEDKVLIKEEMRCYYCGSTRNFDLINNMCNNCNKYIGYSKHTMRLYKSNSCEYEIPSVKKNIVIKRNSLKIDNSIGTNTEENVDKNSTCNCAIV
jgi:hypothetical protein